MSRSVRQEILSVEREQVRAFNRGDVRGALGPFDRSFVGFSSTRHERIRGLRPLAGTFRYYLRRGSRLTYRIAEPVVQVSQEVAVATFYWSVRIDGGRPIQGRGTHVFVHRRGEWRIVHEHFSRAH